MPANALLLDMDIRDAWFPHSRLSRALMVSYKWRATHGQYSTFRQAT